MSQPTERLGTALADRYRILRPLGAGGMATVYLAEDVKHERQVALKVLKPELAAVLGAERFVQEIKTTAQMSHPHILPLFDSGAADGFLYYVMPYVEGETLRDRLNRETQLPVEDALRIAAEVLDALEYAHSRGIIHRDIKPENILLQGGRPMVADFGIALAVSAAAGGRMTETGLSLGTPHYMSPEQATADKEITGRSDVYSLASVLYEMLSGEPPHMGTSAQQIIMKIIADEPKPVTALRKSVPPHVAAALGKALQKLPADRFATAREFSQALRDVSFTTAAMVGATGMLPAVATQRQRALAAVAAVALAVAAWGWLRPMPEPPTAHRYLLALPEGQAPLAQQLPPVFSPDGGVLAYIGPVPGNAISQQIWLKRREQASAEPLVGTQGAFSLQFSPDGQWLVYSVTGGLRKVRVSGGVPVTLANTPVIPEMPMVWRADGQIVFARPDSARGGPTLGKMSADGGSVTPLFRDSITFQIFPQALPGTSGTLFSSCLTPEQCNVMGARDDESEPVLLVENAFGGQVVGTEFLIYEEVERLMAVRFDPKSLKVLGDPVPLSDSIGDTPVRVSGRGTLTVIRSPFGLTLAPHELVWVSPRGVVEPVDTAFSFVPTVFGSNHGLALSPDGRTVALGVSTESNDHIWLKDVGSPRGRARRLTLDVANNFRPRWSPDGRAVLFLRGAPQPGVVWRRADGAGRDSILLAGEQLFEVAPHPTGSVLVRGGGLAGASGGRDLYRWQPGDTALAPFSVGAGDEDAVRLSPDGRWVVYHSDESSAPEVYLRSYDQPDEGRWQVTTAGGYAPLWARDGQSIFFLGRDFTMYRVGFSLRDGVPVLGTPEALFPVPQNLRTLEYFFYTPWDVAPDGRFLMARRRGDVARTSEVIVVVEHLESELRRLLPK